MTNKKSKKICEKTISIFEILILVTSVLTFAYFIGDEFRLVGAEDGVLGLTEIGKSALEGSVENGFSLPSFSTFPTDSGVGGLGLTELGGSALEGSVATQVASSTTGTPTLAKIGTNLKSFGWANIITNAVVGLGLYWGTYYLLSGVFGSDEAAAYDAAGYVATGYGLGTTFAALTGSNWGLTAFNLFIPGIGLIGAGIGLAWWVVFGIKEQESWVLQYNCNPWQPQTGGENCDICNKGDLPCTEYKCESLGASCALVNQGTDEEACTWKNRNDKEPPTITAWKEALSEDYEYVPYTSTYPEDKGVIIEYTKSDDKCAPAFSKITYGVSLNKLGICKIDSIRKTNFSDMSKYVDNIFKENHTISSLHGGVVELEKEGIELANGGEYEIFVRCNSANDVANIGTFVFKYCVQSQPDTNAPVIKLTDPYDKWPIESGKTSQEVNVYTDKPADCKWSHNDEGYDDMANIMTCSQSITEMNANSYYKCNTTLTGLKDNIENKFYFNCKSYPLNAEADRYTMGKNVQYSLIGTQPLVIDSVSPEKETVIKDSTESVKVTLTAKTSAGFSKEGTAWCSFKTTGSSDNNYVLFSNTNSYESSQTLWLDEESYEYSIKCCDVAELTGNCDEEETNFEVETDFESPLVVRVYNDEAQLKIITHEESECVYSTNDCSYDFDDGLKLTTTNNKEHFAEWDTDNNIYVKCKDGFGNKPDPDECTIIARPFTSY